MFNGKTAALQTLSFVRKWIFHESHFIVIPIIEKHDPRLPRSASSDLPDRTPRATAKVAELASAGSGKARVG